MHTETTNEQPAKDNDQTHFGYQSVSADQKTRLVSDVFASVAENYDIMNDVMSGGVHRLWKARFVRGLGLRPGMRVLDLAGGTGDIGFAIAEQLLRRAARDGQDNGHQPPVTICDINPAMLAVGRDRAGDRGLVDAVTWSCGNAEDLPFDDREFDRVTISFGLRNVTHIDKALA
ncbi:MAG: class I SAM-dependent methyltransferase, partial [Pseudomonadota bacterium]